MPTDVLDVVEAAYRFDTPPAEWLKNLARVTYPQIGDGHGVLAFAYRVTEEGRMQVSETQTVDMPDAAGEQVRMMLEQLPPGYVSKTFVRCECVTQSQVRDPEVVAFNAPIREMSAAAFGWHDQFIFGGMDPTGHGLCLNAPLSKVTRLPARVRETWCRVAVHVATAHRLRRRLGVDNALRADGADALLRPDGRVEHATGEAQAKEARASLRTAVRAVEGARGSLRRRDPDRAIDHWKGLVSARWTLVDHFESDGKRYVLARRNDVDVAAREALTARERQALGYAALGHSNKLIAYEMGVSPSTVGVLLHRAARKLGAKTRAELIAVFARSQGGAADQ
ncbi:MAG TPA: LuxR C-terminal-related transcriptional regulator [Polyangia bacterium]